MCCWTHVVQQRQTSEKEGVRPDPSDVLMKSGNLNTDSAEGEHGMKTEQRDRRTSSNTSCWDRGPPGPGQVVPPAAGQTSPARALVPDFQPLGLTEDEVLLLKPRIGGTLLCSGANQYTGQRNTECRHGAWGVASTGREGMRCGK